MHYDNSHDRRVLQQTQGDLLPPPAASSDDLPIPPTAYKSMNFLTLLNQLTYSYTRSSVSSPTTQLTMRNAPSAP